MSEQGGSWAADGVAVVGIGCRLPGAVDHHAFHANLMAGVCSVGEVTADRWDTARHYSPDFSAAGKSISKWCGQIDGVHDFDNAFFGITPKEARMLDPQQRLLLEQTWRCAEDAGIAPDTLRAARTSVHIGVMARDHLQRVSSSSEPTDGLSAIGGYDFMLANRLSHTLGLTGPSAAVDAACASSLVALHHGARALLDDEVDFAIAGGVSLNLHPWRYIAFSKARMLSPDGRCKTFDRAADGYVPGEGVAVVLLRRLSDAVADGDHIYGVLAGSAVNHGGARRTITAPTIESQRAVIAAALRRADVAPQDIGYVEAHGTGTSLGDPIEVHALREAFGARTGERCLLGSVKPNIGHLEAAAGMAGLIKVLMMMADRRVPPSIHLDEPNPLLDIENSPFALTTEPLDWVADGPLTAGVSSFGMGGVNSHVIVRQGPAVQAASEAEPGPRPFLLSAATGAAFERLRARWTATRPRWRDTPTADIAATVTSGRAHHQVRAGAVVTGSADIERFLAEDPTPRPVTPRTWWVRIAPTAVPEHPADLPRPHAPLTGRAASVLDDLLAGRRGPEQECLHTYLVLADLDRAGFRPAGIAARGGAVWPALALAGALSMDDALNGARDGAADLRWSVPRLSLVDPTGAVLAPHPLGVAYLADLLVCAEQPSGESRAAIADAAVMVETQHTLRAALTAWNQALAEHCGGEAIPLTRAGLEASPDETLPARGLACQYAIEQVRDRWSLPSRRHLRGPVIGEVLDLLADGVLTPAELLEFETADDARRAAIATRVAGRGHLASQNRPYPRLRSGDHESDLAAWVDASVRGDCPAAPNGVAVLDIGLHGRGSPEVAVPELTDAALVAARVALWTAGVDLDWSAWTAAGSRRVPLPVYEFEPVRHEPVPHPEDTSADPAPRLHQITTGWQPACGAAEREPGALLVLADPADRDALRGSEAVPPVVRWADITADAVAGEMPDDVVVIGGRCTPEQVLLIARALAGRSTRTPKRLICAGAGDARHSALAGLARSLRLEGPDLRITVLRTDAADPDELWRDVLAELAVDTPADHVRYTAGRRETEVIAARTIEPPNPTPVYRPGGVYLVTGGAGGLGVLVKDHILSVPDTTVVLVGRSAAPALLGGAPRVAYFAADVTDSEAMRSVVAEVDERFGQIDGVIHAAGVLRDSLLREKSVAGLRAVLAPKTAGVHVLDEVTQHEPLAFFAVFSSVVATIGNLGQTDYATANAYLDAFPAEREARRAAGECAGDTVSVAWPLWADGGMSPGDTALSVFRDGGGLHALPTAIGLALLDHALAGPTSSQRFLFGRTERIAELCAPPAPARTVAVGAADARALAEDYVRDTVAALTEANPHDIDLDAGLDEVGIDSILVSQFNVAVERDLGAMAHTLLFECRTLAEVADRIARQRGDRLTNVAQGRAATTPSPATAETRPSAPAAGPVAIIGMSGRYPQAPDLTAFWENLLAGRDCVTEVPAERWTPAGGAYCSQGGFLADADAFDPLFFAMSPREAELTDPQERLFLQAAWHALEDAGYPPHRLGAPGERAVGVFAGVTTQTYQLWGARPGTDGENAIPTSTQWSIANRVSYSFDLSGPSMPVDTACASSLSAIHLACASLAAGECRMALVGAVNLYLHPVKYEWLCQMQMLSRTGRCHTFGDGADGFVPGEGVGALLLKPLSDAVADGDRVHGVITGSAVNHGGRTAGFTVPNPNAQADLVRAALRAAGADPASIGYVEAHGTGTPLGDPIEIAGLTKAFDEASDRTGVPLVRQSLPIGSVKTNIGHLESAAGLAGLTKILLQMRHGVLAPSLNAERDNPRIDFAGSPFRVQRAAEDWARLTGADGAELPRRAGISSFGAGGANAHVVVEEYWVNPDGSAPPREDEVPGPHVVAVSARESTSLREHSANLAAALRAAAPRADAVAYQLQVRREPLAERVAFLADDLDQMITGLLAVAAGEHPARSWTATASRRGKRPDGLAEAVAGRDLAALARLWTEGAAVPWQDLHDRVLPPVDLPGYPFAQERHTVIPESQPAPDGRTDHASRSALLTAADPVLDDHRVNGTPIFPAVAYLEMVRAAVAESGQHAIGLRNNVWTSAITVPDTKRVSLELTSTPTGYDYEIHSTPADGSREVHASGKVDTAGEQAPVDGIELATLRLRCAEEMSAARFYPRIHSLGLQLGPSYQGITALHHGDGEVLTEVSLPEHVDVGRYVLHPVLFDAALQGSLALVDRIDPGALHLPFSIGEVQLTGPLPARFLAHVVLRATTPAAKKIDVTAVDDTGRPILVVRDLWLRRWDAAPAAGAFFRPRWTVAEPGPADDAGGAPLLLAPGSVASGWPGAVTATVADPADAARVLAESGAVPRDIVVAWPSTGTPAALADLVRAALAATKDPLRLLLVHPDDHETGDPARRALGGLLRTVAREHPRLAHRAVSLLDPRWRRFLDGDPAQAAALRAELDDDWAAGDTVRHTAAGRQVLTWERAVPDGKWRPNAGDTYLISGGAGGLGLILAGELARQGAAVALTGRSPADERIESEVDKLRAGGVDAAYLPADISDPEQTQDLVAAVRERFGGITGVFHAAGVLRDAYLHALDLADLAAVAAPKILGARNLDAATADDDLREFVLFSSVASPLGTVGQAAYAHANAYLDAFAAARQAKVDSGERSGRTHAINWPLWRDGGMTVDAEVEAALAATFGIRPLETGAGLAALAEALTCPPGQVLFVPGDGSKVAALLGLTRPAETPSTPGPTPAASALGHGPAVAAAVIAEVAAIVKLDPARVRATAEIGDYGFDSLSFTRLANRINDLFGVDVTPALFFEHTTVADISAHLVETYPDALTTALGPASIPLAAPTPAVVVDRAAPQAAPREPIAIVGMHGMMPRSDDLAEYWENLLSGRDLVTEIPSERWDWRDYYSPSMDSPGKTNSKWGGFLRAVDEFDHRFFGISPREAALMDPQQRIFLQTAYKAIEEAGYRPADLARGRTGLFVGVATHDYYELLRDAGVPVEAYTTTGMFHAILANRVSYLLNLKGPSFPIDTACSSSLVAVRSAVEAIWSGSCEAAIAGGVNLLIAPMIYISFARAGMLSPTGRCRTFDADADGYVRGEGAGALLLKPLSEALRDGDHVHAVIRGSAVNHGGRVNTLTTPNPNAQSELIVHAFRESGVDPATVGYMEMHGTGTALGDPIEFNGLKKAFRVLREDAGLSRLTAPTTLVGSVKTNIGHLEAAAGMAGIFKAVLSMRHGRIPGNLHLNQLNPQIKLDGGPFRIADSTTEWQPPTGPDGGRLPRRAGVSSFGFGGVNGHVLLEEHLEASPPEPHDGAIRVFVLSARSAERLRAYAADLAEALTPARGDHDPAAAERLRQVAAELLGISEDEVGLDEPVIDLGFEGALVSALRAQAQEQIGVPAGDVVPSRTLRQIAAHAAAPRSAVSARDLAFTLQLGRTEMASRFAVVTGTVESLAAALRAFADTGDTGPGCHHADTGAQPASGDEQPLDPTVTAPAVVAERWVHGHDVDWAAAYRGTRPRRLSLPTYPFATTSHWIPAAQPRAPRQPADFTRRIDPGDRVVAEHRVHGDRILPGVGQLALVVAALRERGIGHVGLRDVAWLTPVQVEAGGCDLRVRLVEHADRVEFTVLGLRDGRDVAHSRGSATLGATAVAGIEDLAGLLNRCGTVVPHDEIYRRFAGVGLDYGPYFRAIDEIRVGAGLAVARFTTGDDPGPLPLAALDAALQAITAAGFATADEEPLTRFPFSAASFDLHGPVPATGHVIVREVDGATDVLIVDEHGHIHAAFGDVVVRAMTDPLAGLVFTPRWVAEPVAAAAARTDGGCLVVAPEHCFGLDQAIAARYGAERVHRVRLGTRTRRTGDRTWEVADDPAAMTALLADLPDIGDVWFLGGVRADDHRSVKTDPVMTFFRLVRALDSAGWSPSLRVVVNDVHDIDGRRVGNPAAGALVGFVQSLAKEHPGRTVTCVDIGIPVAARPTAVTVDTAVTALLAEPGSSTAEVALLDGVRHVRRLHPTALPTGGPTPFRHEGVYLVIGGAGGIGQVLAKHLASTAAARVALVGRSPRTADTDALIDDLAARGGKAAYFAADVADTDAMRDVLTEVERTFGEIHGVVHAAMVLRDGIVDRMGEADLADVVRPKVDGSDVLAGLLARRPLDFLLFLSSVQSFTAAPGQANYAAASTGQDCLARHWARRVGYPVRVINWGFWGSVGRVATEEYRQGLAARGFGSITPHEGITAIERVLAGDEQQVAVVKADHRALATLGASRAPAPPAPRAAAPVDLGSDAAVVRRQVDEAIAAAALRVLRGLGLWTWPGQGHTREALTASAGIAARHGRLVGGLVDLMVGHGFLIDTPNGLIRAERSGDGEIDAAVAALADLRERRPELRARLALVRQCLAALPQVLTGQVAATEVLFPAGSTDLVAPVYQGDPLTDYCNDLVAKQVAAAARKAAATGSPVQVLEIGGGTGGTTRAVLRELAASGIRARYTFTDVSPRFLRQAEQVLRAEGVELRFAHFDVTRSAAEQGITPGVHHVVVAANVLHATPDLDSALGVVRSLLADGGAAVLTEVTAVEAFHMITFGLLDGWWNFADPHRRLAHSPLLDTGMWRSRLLASGFADVRVEGTARGGRPAQRVIVGVASGAPAARPVPQAPHPAPRGVGPVAPARPTGDLVGLLREITADCLDMPVSDVDADATLSAYGVDSIVGVELITRVNAALGVVVRTIALFDHPTITELAGHLLDRHADAVTAWLGQAGTPAAPAADPTPPFEPFSPARAATGNGTRSDHSDSHPTNGANPRPAPSGGPRAVRFVRPGDPSALVIAEHVPTAPGPGEVEVLVRAFPINFSDFLLARGLYPMGPEFPFTPGVEVSGVVGRIGPGVTRVAPGDEVIALTRPEMGGQATSVVTDESFVVAKPASVSHEEACGFPVAFLAMYLAFERARPLEGERVLIPAATGTNGLIAVQLAQLAGAEVIATAGGPRKVDHLAAMGVHEVIDHNQVDFAEEVLRRTGGHGVDVVVNALGDGALQKGLNVLAPDGRYVEIAVFGLQSSGAVDLSRLVDNQSFHSFNTKKFFLRHPDRRTAYLDTMAEHLASGAVRPTVAHVFPFDRVAEAYAAKQDRSVIGRVVVSVPDPSAAPVTASNRATGPSRSGDIAVIGMSARFPGADDVDQLWENLADGVDSIREVPADRWSSLRFFDPDQSRLDTTYCKWGGFLDDVDRFDAAFFSISGKEAAHTDPQQRLFLEEAWKAIQDSGSPAKSLNGARCGVFVGVGPSDYLTRMNKADATRHAQVFWGNEASILAARISYFLNLRGPSVAVNTACSSSLVALHLACQSLGSGETEIAVAGGVFLTLAPDYLVVASNGTMLSPHGRCRTFDDSADGFAPGEGVGALVLKPLERAIADGDRIHGVIKGTATNQDGKTNGITAPSGRAQTEVELAAYARAGISADTIGYIEAHGTGTKLGDPIEVDALTTAFRAHTDRVGFCPIGSVKTNIGHTAAAAGIAGIIKVLLSFRHGKIPPSLHYRTPNRHIDFATSPFFVNTELRDWPRVAGAPRRAAVSSFGFSGTNAHVVVEEPPVAVAVPAASAGPLAVPLSARTASALQAGSVRLGQWLAGQGDKVTLADVAYSCQVRRDHFTEHRAVFVVADRAELVARLRAGDPGREVRDDGVQGRAARRYLDGEQVDWAQVWPGPARPPVSLPGYAFDRSRHWFTEHDTVYSDSPQRLIEITGTDELDTVRATFTGADRYVRDHVVNGRVVVPAALHLEAVAQAARSLGKPCDQFTDVVWLRPLLVDEDEPVAVDIRFATGGRFTILSADDNATVLVQGAAGHRDRPQPAAFDLTADEIDCPYAVDPVLPYRRMSDAGLRHGPSLVVLSDIATGHGRAVAAVGLPDGSPGADTAVLHPALLDGALQLLAVLDIGGRDTVALPFAVERIARWAPLRSPARVVATARGGAVPAYDIRVHDQNGAVLVELTNLTIKAVGGGPSRSAERLRALLKQVRDGDIHVDKANSELEAILGD
jgi:acyl transferase domain-containing protein/D-arabinose 1-dehydrogenase-like Zn-dependent alcohol dehydrogenase/acyl carrier protein